MSRYSNNKQTPKKRKTNSPGTNQAVQRTPPKRLYPRSLLKTPPRRFFPSKTSTLQKTPPRRFSPSKTFTLQNTPPRRFSPSKTFTLQKTSPRQFSPSKSMTLQKTPPSRFDPSMTFNLKKTPQRRFSPSKTYRVEKTSPERISPGSTSPTSPKNYKLHDVKYYRQEVGKYGKWVPGRAEKVGDDWSPGNRRMRLIEAVPRRRNDRHFSKSHVLRMMIAQYKKGRFEPERDQHDQQLPWPMPKQTYDDALKLFYSAIGQSVLNKAPEVTEENPLGTPAMAPDITRTDLVGRHQRRRFLMNHEASDREHVKRMQRLFEEGMKSDEDFE